MRAVLLGLGSRGDVEPCVSLGTRLAERGHDVTVVAPARYDTVVTGAGLAHHPLAVDPTEVMASEEGQAFLNSGPLGFIRGVRTLVQPLADEILRDSAAAAAGTDVVIAPAIGGLGRALGDKLRVPSVLMHFQPSEPTRQFPNPLLGERDLGGPLNRFSYIAIEEGSDLLLRPVLNGSRRRVLGLKRLWRSAAAVDRSRRVPVLCTVSPVLVPRPADWPAHVHLTGAWRPGRRRPLPEATEEFLRAGERPVYVGFGSMVPADPKAMGELVVGAARAVGRRVIVQGLPVDEGADVHAVDDIDHEALFSRTAVVAHHGGAGTTHAALRSGVPSVVVPFFGDQPFFASKVRALGAGLSPGRAKELTVDGFAGCLRQALEDQAMRRRAAEIGTAVAAEDGAARAADVVEGFVGVRS